MSDTANIENVYAIAASTSGERLLRRLGFDEIRSAQNRADKHDVFVVKFDELVTSITAICSGRFPEPPDVPVSAEVKNDTEA